MYCDGVGESDVDGRGERSPFFNSALCIRELLKWGRGGNRRMGQLFPCSNGHFLQFFWWGTGCENFCQDGLVHNFIDEPPSSIGIFPFQEIEAQIKVPQRACLKVGGAFSGQ